jgi:hypothetical protein
VLGSWETLYTNPDFPESGFVLWEPPFPFPNDESVSENKAVKYDLFPKLFPTVRPICLGSSPQNHEGISQTIFYVCHYTRHPAAQQTTEKDTVRSTDRQVSHPTKRFVGDSLSRAWKTLSPSTFVHQCRLVHQGGDNHGDA